MKKIILITFLSIFSSISIANTGEFKEATLKTEIKSSLYSDDAERKVMDIIAKNNIENPHYAVGVEFIKGELLEVNAEKALFWLAQSSEIEKNNKADYIIAEIYAKGLMDKRYYDIKKAIFFYERAANRGNKEAKLKLAVNYLYNDRVLDKDKGLYWLNKSLLDKNLTALQLYTVLTLTAEDGPTVLKHLDFVLSRAEAGDHLSSFYLGLIYLKGNILKRDLSESKKYFLMAFSQGNIVSEEFLVQIDRLMKETTNKGNKKEIEKGDGDLVDLDKRVEDQSDVSDGESNNKENNGE